MTQLTGGLINYNTTNEQVMSLHEKFTVYEQKGYQIYKSHCAGCHPEPLFTDFSFRNNGLALNRMNDAGRMKITGYKTDSLKFMVPSLRNVQLSPPYMHDGSIAYITKVITHYTKIDTGLLQLDPQLKKPILLSERNKTELLSFLFALTDTSFTKSKKFGPEENISFRH